jgi:hypothetical protein
VRDFQRGGVAERAKQLHCGGRQVLLERAARQSATEGLYYTKLPKVLHDQGEQLLSQMTVNGQPLK